MATLMHILGARYDPLALLVAEDGVQRTYTLEGHFAWQVGGSVCTGYWADGWHPCPDQAPVAEQCLACFRGRGDPERRDDQPACIFEPRCKGDAARCVCSFGGVRRPVPHVVYLALYGGLPKVGMTMAGRVDTRLKEQGADAYFIIQETPDRATARKTEQQIAFMTGIPEWRRHQEILPQWTRPVDRERIRQVADHWHDELGTRYDVGTLVHIEHDLAPLQARPMRVDTEGRHRGTWIGGRGGYLFYEPDVTPLGIGGAVHAIKRGDLTGRVVQPATP